MQQLGYNLTPVDPRELPQLGEEASRLLARMLGSPEFLNSERMSRFLRYVFERTLAGDEASLKESTIGVTVFDRVPGYNPKTDPVVRSEARRLRDKIQRYFEGDGRDERLRVQLPKGGYVAAFHWHSTAAPPETTEPVAEPLVPFEPTPETTAPPPAVVDKRRPGVLVALALLLTGIAAGAVAGVVLTRRAMEDRAVFAQTGKTWTYPLTSLPGQELDATISPDGRTVAFISNSDRGDFDLYTIAAAGGEPKRITATPERDLHPAYSPDGRQLAFLRTSPAGIEVWTVQEDGSAPVKLTELRWYEWFNWRSDPLFSNSYPGPAWTPDGRSLILSDVAGSQQGAALWEFDVKTKARRQITGPRGLSHDFFPAVSPDGRRVIFARQFSASNCDLYLLDRSSGTERRLTHDEQDIRGLAWMPDGETVVFSSSRGGPYQLWRLHTGGGEPVAIPAAGDRLMNPAMSRDGRLLVYSNATININLWRKSLGEATPPVPVVTSTGQNLYPRFSPDGSQIAWASDRTGGWEIWTGNSDGTGQRQLTRLTNASGARKLGTPRWSPDGAFIAFDARLQGNSGIYIIAAAGGDPRPLDRNEWEERNPSFSVDGQWVYFNSNRGGTVQIWRKRADGQGVAERVTTRRGYDAVESANPAKIWFLPALPEPGIWGVNRDGSEESILLPTISFLVRRHWDAAGRHLYFVGHDATPRTLMRYRPGTQSVQRVAELDRELIADVSSIAVSPDERYVLYARPDVLNSDLIAIRSLTPPEIVKQPVLP